MNAGPGKTIRAIPTSRTIPPAIATSTRLIKLMAFLPLTMGCLDLLPWDTNPAVAPRQIGWSRGLLWWCLVWLAVGVLGDEPPERNGAKLQQVLDLSGRTVDPFQKVGSKAIVLFFVANECPISNSYAPEVRRLFEKYSTNGVVFWLVHPDGSESVEAIRRHVREYEYPMTVLRDPGHTLVRRARITVTPGVAVFLPDGRLLYHGRIDNRYVDFGKARPKPTRHDLEEVLEAVILEKPVGTSETRAIGCYIPDTSAR
jgi:hypothetical protein